MTNKITILTPNNLILNDKFNIRMFLMVSLDSYIKNGLIYPPHLLIKNKTNNEFLTYKLIAN